MDRDHRTDVKEMTQKRGGGEAAAPRGPTKSGVNTDCGATGIGLESGQVLTCRFGLFVERSEPEANACLLFTRLGAEAPNIAQPAATRIVSRSALRRFNR